MRLRLHGRAVALLVGSLVAFQWALSAQTPAHSTGSGQAAAKRPITYEVVDYWRSIQGTRLSNDGRWLAYSLTSQGEGGGLNLPQPPRPGRGRPPPGGRGASPSGRGGGGGGGAQQPGRRGRRGPAGGSWRPPAD